MENFSIFLVFTRSKTGLDFLNPSQRLIKKSLIHIIWTKPSKMWLIWGQLALFKHETSINSMDCFIAVLRLQSVTIPKFSELYFNSIC